MLLVAQQLQRFCHIVMIPLTPVKTTHLSSCNRGLFELFTSCLLSPPLHFKERKVEFFKTNALFCSIHGRASLAMEGKSVVPML